ncbi:hypothetical protein OEB99_00170 [Actinotalea sp. M2MS4P-6]|uniref:hypothetical protein n=1 Tax=Actinotalea sp. M2MS4P-6 TaxID=2983762 RepID=UPI0021E4C667|nr:hypothetical protein [Actinotalea sp. M2MS4P-6]MCV2392712.1 hypothetical protein [Actinotalea sp. M2MS4P-6]
MTRAWYACTATGSPDAFALAILETIRPYALIAEARIDDDFAGAPADAVQAFEELVEPRTTWQRTVAQLRRGHPVARVHVTDDDDWARLLACAAWVHTVEAIESGQASVARMTDRGHLAVVHLPEEGVFELQAALRGVGTLRELKDNAGWWSLKR